MQGRLSGCSGHCHWIERGWIGEWRGILNVWGGGGDWKVISECGHWVQAVELVGARSDSRAGVVSLLGLE